MALLPLVRISNYAIRGSWSAPIAGAIAFAVSGRHVLFHGSYEDRDGYLLCGLPQETSGALRPLVRLTPHDAMAATRRPGRRRPGVQVQRLNV
jgi:hypothetical protein